MYAQSAGRSTIDTNPSDAMHSENDYACNEKVYAGVWFRSCEHVSPSERIRSQQQAHADVYQNLIVIDFEHEGLCKEAPRWIIRLVLRV